MRKRLAVALSLASAGSMVVLAAPADAGQGVTFTLTAGALQVSDPADKALGTVATGTASITSTLGNTTVTDNRGALLGTWTASVAGTDFTTGLGTADETITKDNVSYYSGVATASSGTAVRVPGQATPLTSQALSASRTAFSATGVVGNNSTTWVPTVVVTIPSDSVAGTYSGTITHSVSGA
ncbi:MAG TPA: hypothetical protein VGX28_10155 [Frankiaceae bacterium]|jgi:hypothetical protein|nr:hypothetical protein [Frankiaceae bacterium]